MATMAKWAIDDHGFYDSGHKIAYKKWNNTLFPWSDSTMSFTRVYVIRGNHWRIASLVTKKTLFTASYTLCYIFPVRYQRRYHNLALSRRYVSFQSPFGFGARCLESSTGRVPLSGGHWWDLMRWGHRPEKLPIYLLIHALQRRFIYTAVELRTRVILTTHFFTGMLLSHTIIAMQL